MPRAANGVYSLPAGNPVVTGTTITSTWANTTMSDLASEMTNSLDRQGRGSMQAALKLTDGTTAAPGLVWGSETTTGFSRPVAGRISVSVLAAEIARFTAAGFDVVSGTLSVGGVSVVPGNYVLKAGDTMTGVLTNSAGLGFRNVTANGTAPGIMFTQTGQRSWQWSIPAAGTGFVLRDVDGGVDVLTALAGGNVGINITPTAGFHVNKDSGSYIAKWQRPGVNSTLAFYTGANEFYIDAEGAGNQLVFATVGVAHARFNAAGAFLMAQTVPMIGIADDASVLALFGSSTAVDSRARLELYGNTHATLARQAILRGDQIIFTASGAATEFGRFSAAGNLGLGFAPTANYKLDVNGTIRSVGGETTSGYGFRVLNSTANGGGSFNAKVGASAGVTLSGDSGPVNYVYDSGAGEAEIGFRGLPGRLTSGGTTLALTDKGRVVIANGAGTITVDDGIFSAGDVVTIINLVGASITIAQAAGMTLRLAGSASTGNRTLADNGVCTIIWVSGSTQAIISGAGLT